jgi:anti-sigma regulatory factor (Ser/Thr protein kinase)
MLNPSVGPDERRLHSTAEREGVSLAPRTRRADRPVTDGYKPAVEETKPAVRICLTLLPEPRSCGLARNAVLDFCRAHGMTDLTADAALLTSELVGNAVEHAGTPITLTAESRAGQLSVRVTDDSAGRAMCGKTEPDLLGERGRGLVVVDAIAAEWGTTLHATGKSVWFRLP